MKKIVSVMIVIAVVFQAYIGFLLESNRETEAIQTNVQKYCQQFSIPDDAQISDPGELFSVLLKTAKETHTNLFRNYTMGNRDEKGKLEFEVIKYCLITVDSPYSKTFTIKRGRQFTPVETQSQTVKQFLSTQSTGKAEQIGLLRNYMWETSLRLEPFYQMTSELKGSGRYYVELPDGVTKEAFLASLQRNIQQEFQVKIPAEKLQGDSKEIAMMTADEVPFECVYGMLMLMVIISLLYSLLRESKHIAVLKLHGVTTGRILWLLLRGVLLVFAVTVLAVMFAVGFFTGDFTYAWQVMRGTLAAYLVSILLVAGIGVLAIRLCHVYQNLNGKSGSKSILYLNFAVKALSVLLILATGQTLYNDVSAYQKNINLYKVWSDAGSYGVFYPFTLGSSVTSKENLMVNKKIAKEIYPVLNGQGALYIDAANFQPEYLSSPTPYMFPSVQVNPNYLKKYPLLDSGGQPVTVSEDETNWVVLAPIHYKNQEAALRKDLLESRQGMNTLDHETFGMPSSTVKGMKLKIIWIADGQKVYSYNPKVAPETAAVLSNVLVQVMTEQNSCIGDRDGVRGNGDADPLKVKLTGTAQKTYEALTPLLKKKGVYENLQHLIATDQYMTEQAAIVQRQMNFDAVIALLLLLVLWLTVTQNMVILFDQNKKDLVVKKLFGWTAVGRFRKYILPGLGISAFMLCGYGVFSLVSKTMQWGYLLSVGIILLVVEGIVSFLTILRTENRKTVDTLKGDS